MPIKTNMSSLVPAREKFKKTITLLSRGYSMPDKIPNGQITIYPWDHEVDEWVIANVKKLQLVKIPYELVKRLVDIGDVSNLPVGDVTTILLVARSLSRQSMVEYTTECPNCSRKEHAKITVPDQLEKVGEKAEGYPGYDDITLPVTKDKLRIRPLLVKDHLAILDRDAPSRAKISDNFAKDISTLMSVNDGKPDSKEEVLSYLKALPPSDLTYLRTQADALSPQLGTDIKHKCDACGFEYVHSLNIDTNFFR